MTIPQVYVSGDDYHLFLLGNDVINREMVHFVSLVGSGQMYVASFGGMIDIVPFELQTPAEREKTRVAQ